MFCTRVGTTIYKGLTEWKKTLWRFHRNPNGPTLDLPTTQQSFLQALQQLHATPIQQTINYHSPLILHSRDGHACSTNFNSALLEQYWLASNYRYLNGTNNHYQTDWHEQRKGLLFGFVSGKKDMSDNQIMPDHQWQQTFGRAFCLTQKTMNDGTLINELTICPDRLFTIGLYPSNNQTIQSLNCVFTGF